MKNQAFGIMAGDMLVHQEWKNGKLISSRIVKVLKVDGTEIRGQYDNENSNEFLNFNCAGSLSKSIEYTPPSLRKQYKAGPIGNDTLVSELIKMKP